MFERLEGQGHAENPLNEPPLDVPSLQLMYLIVGKSVEATACSLQSKFVGSVYDRILK